MPRLIQTRTARAALTLGAWALCALAFIPLYPLERSVAGTLVTLPTILTGWLFGTWGGLLGGLGGILLDVLLFTWAGEAPATFVVRDMLGFALLPTVGALVGWLRDGRERLQRALIERAQTQEKIRRQSATLGAINAILEAALTAQTPQDVARECLAIVQELTGSRFGFVGLVNQDGRLDPIALSDPDWDACTIPESRAAHLLRDMSLRGLWAAAIRDGRSLVANDPASHPDSMGVPEGHPPLTAFLGVPLRRLGRTIGMIGLANKEGGYDEADRQAAEAVAVAKE